MTLRDATAEPWEALAALAVPNYPDHEDPDREKIQARRDAIRAAKDRMHDETAHARVLARRGLPAEPWPEGDPRLEAWRSILWERLEWERTDVPGFAPREGYSTTGLRAVEQRIGDASRALALLLADAEGRPETPRPAEEAS